MNSPFINKSQRRILPRSTYTPKNAFRWKPIFDEMLASREEVLIPFKQDDLKKVSPLTLRQQLSDGLLWLVDNSPEEIDKNNKYPRQDYQLLRSEIRMTIEENGVRLLFKNLQQKPAKSIKISSEDQEHWKERFSSFINSNEANLLFLKNLSLSERDQEFIKNTLSTISAGWEYEVTEHSIKIIK